MRSSTDQFSRGLGQALGIALTTCSLVMTPSLVSAQLEEIVVTAQRREESLQDVPIAMQAFNGDQLSTLGIDSASDIIKLAPNLNLSAQNPANQAINIRGVGTNDFFGNAPGSVGIYMDDVIMSSPYLTAVGIYDMERVEILRGPQNSLFGRNTTGGAVNYISKLPEIGGDSDGYVRGTLGSYSHIGLEAAGSFQLSDTIALRLAGKSYDRDGIWNNMDAGGAAYGEKDRKSARGTLVWEPTNLTSVIANLHWAREDSEIDPYRHVGTRTTAENGAAADGAFVGPAPLADTQLDFDGVAYNTVNGQGIDPSFSNWADVNRTGSNAHDMDTRGVFLKINHDFEAGTFTSITSYDDSNIQFSIDFSGSGNNTMTPADILAGDIIDQDQEFEQFGQEFRFTSPTDQTFRWTAGLYYFSEDSELSQNVRFGSANILSAPPAGPPIVQGGSFALWDVSQELATGFPEAAYSNTMAFTIAALDDEVISPYLHTEYDITDQLSLTIGLRHTSEKKSMPSMLWGILDTSALPTTTFFSNDLVRQQAAAQGLGPCSNNGRRCAEVTTRNDLDFDEWGGKVGLDYQSNDGLMVYGSYSRGIRSGKYDIEFLHGNHTGFPLQDVDVETLDAWEFGFKSDLLDGSMQLNASVFFYSWENQQTFFVDPVTGPAFANIPEAEIQGAELEFRWAPADDWQISAAVGLLDTEITQDGPTAIDQLGHELPFAADSSFNLFVSKDIAIGDGLLILQADYQGRSSPKTGLSDLPLIDELGSLSVLNVRATYTIGPEQQYEIAIYGDNLTKDRYCNFQFNLDVISGVAYCIASDGQRFWGVQGSVRF